MPEGLDNLLERLGSALPVRLRHIPDRLRDTAQQLDMRVALAGGVVRDLVRLALGQLTRDDFAANVRDFDIVVEGPPGPRGGAAIGFAYELFRRLPGKLTVNEAFHTATIASDDDVQLDLATSRTEEYPIPGSLPAVDISGISLEQDLPRRDFSINAVALELYPAQGRLVDPLGGAGDIRDGLVRTLHAASFVDDPTRLLRSLRYSMRLNYNMEPVTRVSFLQAVDDGVLDCLSPERVRYEVECIGREPRWLEVWGIMDLVNITDSLAAPLGGISKSWDLEDAQALDIALGNQAALLAQDTLQRWLLRTAWLLRPLSDEHLGAVTARLGLFPRQVQLLHAARELLRACGQTLAVPLPPSRVVMLLEQWPRAAVTLALFTFAAAGDGPRLARRQMLRYLDTYSAVRGNLNGHDLVALGAPPGKPLGWLRDQLRYQRLDGLVSSDAEERAAALELIEGLRVRSERTGEEE